MKKVFSSNSQLAHVWANQSQSEGRASNFFFEGTDLYSYGYHYLAGVVHTAKNGTRFALIRSDVYSHSTGRHLSLASRACYGLMPSFRVEAVRDTDKALVEIDMRGYNRIVKALKKQKVTSIESVESEIEYILDAFKEASEFRELIGKPAITAPKKDLDAVREHFAKRFKRYQELNTPEAIAKREKEYAKRQEKKREAEKNALAERINKFRAGEYVGYLPMTNELLRFKGDNVETSRGALVPLAAAETLYAAIKAGVNVIGQRIGHFQVIAVSGVFSYATNEVDTLVTIGCHKILMSEAARLFENKKLTA